MGLATPILTMQLSSASRQELIPSMVVMAAAPKQLTQREPGEIISAPHPDAGKPGWSWFGLPGSRAPQAGPQRSAAKTHRNHWNCSPALSNLGAGNPDAGRVESHSVCKRRIEDDGNPEPDCSLCHHGLAVQSNAPQRFVLVLGKLEETPQA